MIKIDMVDGFESSHATNIHIKYDAQNGVYSGYLLKDKKQIGEFCCNTVEELEKSFPQFRFIPNGW